MTSWLGDGEKYALIGLKAKIEQHISFRQIVPGLWVWTDHRFELPDRWRDWIGSIRADEIENCNLALLSKMPSSTVDVLDGENSILQKRVWSFYLGLLLSSTFTPAHRPIALTGSRRNGVIDVRQESALDIPAKNLFRHYPPILAGEIERAASLATFYEKLVTHPPIGGAWRIFRSLSVYYAARTTNELLDRLHQYCRCIDGLIFSEPGSGLKQFKHRTELFIGPRDHDLMGELYTIRSDVEHLHEHKYLEIFDRAVRLELVRKEAIAEHVARNAVAHIISTPNLWTHFGNTAGLASFWKLDPDHRQKVWGVPNMSTAAALVGYNPDDIANGELA
jgi:hypothetical protein